MIRRGRKKMRTSLSANLDNIALKSLYFDGRKDKTKRDNKTMVEEHITLLSEPNSLYLDHVSPESQIAQSIQESIFNFMKERTVCREKL